MARIVFAAPGIERYHLHERLGRELVQRGHHVDVLALDRVTHTFWPAQQQPTHLIEAERPDPMRAPLTEFADRECARRGIAVPTARHHRTLQRIERRLARQLPPLVRWLSQHQPDLLLLHGPRSAERQLLQFAGRELGIRVLWTGDGLLPHTLQVDDRGLDADASSTRRDPFDYRVVPNDAAMLDACLANLLANTAPFGLSRREIERPRLGRRLRDAIAAGDWHGALWALHGWRAALPATPAEPRRVLLPDSPFVAVLLQAPDDERLRLDAKDAPSAAQLVRASVQAARELDQTLRTVAVLPAEGLHHRQLRALVRLPGLTIAPFAMAAEAAATAVATTTVNHPLAIAALLAGTPVLHTGRALYGLPEVTCRVPTTVFAQTLRAAAATDAAPTLRQRFLTWIIGHTHLWCSPTLPDHNGMIGMVQEIETRLAERGPRGPTFHYRRGPAWPLSV